MRINKNFIYNRIEHYIGQMSENKKFHLPEDIDLEYKKFVFELIKREKDGEKIDFEKESVNFWNKKLKEAVKNQKTS